MPPDPESVSLPKPPPPRPARRDAAIEAALRRFDGREETPPARPAARNWTRHPQFGLALAASLVVVVGLPTAIIALRNDGLKPAAPAATPFTAAPRADTPAQRATVPNASPAIAGPMRQPRSAPQAGVVSAPVLSEPKVAATEDASPSESPAMPVVAAAPPPPAPPPPAPALAQKSADAGAGEVVVTGSRIRQPSLTSPSPVTVVGRSSAERDEVANFAKDRAYSAFLRRLQGAVRANDPGAVVKLISFPLRVNSGGRSQIYPNAKSVRRDYDNIFTPRVRQSILAQRSDRLFSRDLGVMVGDGEVWFDHVCSDDGCSGLGPVRITAINR